MKSAKTDAAKAATTQSRRKETTPSRSQPIRFGLEASFLRLHQTIGNRAVGQMLQAKLRVNEPGDKYEQEAGRVADMVMRMREPVVQRRREEDEEEDLVQMKSISAQPEGLLVQRKCAACASGKGRCPKCKEEEESIQRQPLAESMPSRLQFQSTTRANIQLQERPGRIPAVTPQIAADIKAQHGAGLPLPASERAFFEPRFGADFTNVRIHAGASSAALASKLKARAFTSGANIFFALGEYQSSTSAGRSLLAHELTHVMQQNGAQTHAVANTRNHAWHHRNGRASNEATQFAPNKISSLNTLPRISHNASFTSVVQRFEASEHVLFGDAPRAALSQIMGWLSAAEHELRQNRSAWRELVQARELWERRGGDPTVLQLLERATNANDEARYAEALRLLERAIPQARAWLQSHPEMTEGGERAPTVIAGREHPEATALIEGDVTPPLTLRTSGLTVTYGEVIALGDFYPDPEAMHRAPREELTNPQGRGILDLIRAEGAGRQGIDFNAAYQEATQWREVERFDNLGRRMGLAGAEVGGMSFGTLARFNPEHFAGENRTEWQGHHHEALGQADTAHRTTNREARTRQANSAYTTNAFGDHFLTDAFAAGHLLYKGEYMRLAGEFMQGHLEEVLEAVTEALLNDHRGAIISLVAGEIPIPVLRFPFAAIVTFVAPGYIKNQIKDKIRTIAREKPDILQNAAVKVAHDYYNREGVEVSNRAGDRWRTFGDDHLKRSASTWQLGSLAVVRSRADVTETLRGTPPANSDKAWDYTPLPPANFTEEAFNLARTLMMRTTNNPLADLFIRNLPAIERTQAFEEQQRERREEAASKRERYLTYLQHIRRTNRIEDRSDSDDVAREIVANREVYQTLTVREKAILIDEMLSGFTGDDDERAILTILRDLRQRGELQSVLTRNRLQRIHSNLHGEEYRQLTNILAPERVPTD